MVLPTLSIIRQSVSNGLWISLSPHLLSLSPELNFASVEDLHYGEEYSTHKCICFLTWMWALSYLVSSCWHFFGKLYNLQNIDASKQTQVLGNKAKIKAPSPGHGLHLLTLICWGVTNRPTAISLILFHNSNCSHSASSIKHEEVST